VKIDGARTAVLGLHWQVNVVKPEGVFGALFAGPVARSGVIDRAATVHAAARHRGIPVAYTRFTVPIDGGGLVPNTPVMIRIAGDPAMRPDSPGAQLIPELAAQPGDLVADNQKLSGLAGSDLLDRLRDLGVDCLVITGVATNLTVERNGQPMTVRTALESRVSFRSPATMTFSPAATAPIAKSPAAAGHNPNRTRS